MLEHEIRLGEANGRRTTLDRVDLTVVCPQCSSDVVGGTSHCPTCGEALGADATPTEGPDRGEAPLVKGGFGSRTAVGVVAAAVSISLAAWWLATTPADQPDVDRPQPSADSFPDREAVPDRAAGPDRDAGTDPVASVETELTADWPPSSVVSTAGAGAPVLGQVTGQYLFVGRPTDVVRIDLDTGDTETYRTMARPIATVDDEILLWARQGLVAAPADDASADPRVLFDRPVDGTLRTFVSSLSVVDRDRLVVELTIIASGDFSPATVLVELSSGKTTNAVVPAQSMSVGGLVTVAAGGTFDFVGGEFHAVFDGQALAAGGRSLIGYRCSDPASCELLLIDRRSGETQDGTLPELSPVADLVFVGPEDRFLLVRSDEQRLWDTKLGRYVAEEFLADEPPGDELAGLAVSTDGRWLASASPPEVRFFNLETGAERSFPLPAPPEGRGRVDQVLFAPQAGAG